MITTITAKYYLTAYLSFFFSVIMWEGSLGQVMCHQQCSLWSVSKSNLTIKPKFVLTFRSQLLKLYYEVLHIVHKGQKT